MCTKVKGGFMSPAWADNLDMLAQSGVLDFDAPAYVTGQAPRYVGGLSAPPSPFDGPAPKGKNLAQPKVDEFQYQKSGKKDIVSNPSWKKWAFGLIAAGGLIFGGWKFKSKIIPKLKNLPKTLKLDKAADFFKKGWQKFTGIFKSKKTS